MKGERQREREREFSGGVNFTTQRERVGTEIECGKKRSRTEWGEDEGCTEK